MTGALFAKTEYHSQIGPIESIAKKTITSSQQPKRNKWRKVSEGVYAVGYAAYSKIHTIYATIQPPQGPPTAEIKTKSQ